MTDSVLHPQDLIEGTYLLASILFIMGLKGLSHPESARRGMFYAEAGMLMVYSASRRPRDSASR